jgi:hypothetical protein
MGVVNTVLDSTTRLKLDRMLDNLLEEFGGRVDSDRIEQLMSESLEEIAAAATVLDFVPLFAYRAARERCRCLQVDDRAPEGRRLTIAPAIAPAA